MTQAVLFFLLAITRVSLLANPLLTLPPGVPANSLSVSTYASGLSFPYSSQVLSDGSLLVGVSTPTNNDYFVASGGLLRLAGPGDPGTTVLSGLPYPVQSVRVLNDHLIAVSEAGFGGTQIVFLSPGATPTSPYINLGSIDFAPSNAGEPFDMTLATRATPGQPGSYDVFFSMNSDTDHTQSTNYAILSGLTSGTLEYNSIAKVTVTPTAGTPIISGFQEIAKGVRNTAGMAFDTAGNLYLTDNGWDIPGTTTSQSADELDFIPAVDIGRGITDFGFPNNYIEYGTGTFVGGQGVPPIAAFQPIAGIQSLGASEIALSPKNFPVGLNNGLFIAFYGTWEQGGANNTTGPILYYDFDTQTLSDFILPGQAGIGHIASLTSTADALFINDMNSTGQIRSGPQNGIIYEIQASTPEPSALLLFVIGAITVAGWSKWRRVPLPATEHRLPSALSSR